MGYRVDSNRMDEILQELSENHNIFAPCLDQQKKYVRFRKISSVRQIVTDRQADFSPKEVFYPISQVMFYFREDGVEEAMPKDDKDILIFARACDINQIRRTDNIFLKNGGTEDMFYKRIRERVRYIIVECTESFENCFCASMGSNEADDYCMAVRFEDDELLVNVCDDDFREYFEGEREENFEVRFIQGNKKKLRIPEINRENLKAVSDLEYWKKFDEKCLACGGCNTVCGTCTCFDTIDVIYEEGSNEGERRRIWSGCMLEDFTRTAGGELSRKTKGANMRFKVFHKFYDYKDRFGDEHMCVGCGRCDIRCPAEISFFDSVCELHDKIENMKAQA